jgi:hypothetical protein
MSHGHYRFPPRSTHLDEAEIPVAVSRLDTCQRVDTLAIPNDGPGQLNLCTAVYLGGIASQIAHSPVEFHGGIGQ